jgi:hypothetical protein
VEWTRLRNQLSPNRGRERPLSITVTMASMSEKAIAEIWASAESSGTIDFAAAATALGVSKEETLEVLAKDALAGAKNFASPPTSHFMDLAVLAIVGGLVAFSWFAYHQYPIAAGRPVRVIIAAPNGVKILQVIAQSDIELKPVKDIQGSFEKLDEVVGRYALRPMTKDDVVTSRNLSSNPLPEKLAGRAQILLPLNSGALANTLSLPGLVSVIATPKCGQTTAKPFHLDDVYIMAFDSSANSTAAVVALKPEQLQLFAPILGCAQFTLAKKFEAPK